mmetsp:Transcript_10510/g.10940  ORF Transcript_10510/g.10940 Transcript_10510/m.10940 type:complete len:104 (-) Transcript_10510:98-409(-)
MLSSEAKNAKLREQDIKIRAMLEAKRNEDAALAVAQWETMLPVKSLAADRRRQQQANIRESEIMSRQISEIRRQKLAALFAADEQYYQEELQSRNLAFRKQRL